MLINHTSRNDNKLAIPYLIVYPSAVVTVSYHSIIPGWLSALASPDIVVSESSGRKRAYSGMAGVYMRLSRYSTECVLIVLLSFAIGFIGIFDRDVWTPDEPRVAAMSLEMVKTGNFIVPHLAGEPFVEKPPLYFACAGLSVRWLKEVIGVAGAARFTTALWGFGVLLFSGLISSRLAGKYTGWMTAGILSTMIGFVENFHWIRVDAALAFFVAASIWALVEVFFNSRPAMFLPAGIFAAGAFLSKGFIGPVLIAIPLFGLIVSRRICCNDLAYRKKDIMFLFAGICIFIFIIGTWIYLFWKHVDADTWYQWFWVNHFGRFSGAATQKGHMHSHDPVYYMKTITMYSLPWMPFVWGWIFITIRKFRSIHLKDRRNELFLLIWGLISYAVLSFPATKRDIYLLPVLPAYAIMAALFLKQHKNNEKIRWLRRYGWFWITISLALLVIVTLLPFITGPFIDKIPPKMQEPVLYFGFRNIVCLICFFIGMYFAQQFRRERITVSMALLGISGMLYMGLFLVPLKILDFQKNLTPGTRAFLSGIPADERSRIAGWNFSQTDLGMFYICGNWAIPQIKSTDRVNTILAGTDAEYDSIILNQVMNFSDVIREPYQIVLEGHPRDDTQYRGLYWVKRFDGGVRTTSADN